MEIRPVESLEWTRCNVVPITVTSYSVHGLKAMDAYWVRVIATNYGGDGEPQGFDNFITAMPPPGEKNYNLNQELVSLEGLRKFGAFNRLYFVSA